MISKVHLDSMVSKIEFYQQFGYIPSFPLIKHNPDKIHEWIKLKPTLVIDINTLQLRLPKYK